MTIPSITPMNVGGVRHLVERAYRESGELQYLRELLVNALEADAKRVEFGPEWHAVELLGVYRLMVADDGKGMAPDDLLKFLNTFGGGGKPIGEAHDNFGAGAKCSMLPWNPAGFVVLSWTETTPDGAMVWLMRDPASGEYGARKIESSEGTFEEVVCPGPIDGFDWSKVKPSWISGHGTVVVALGATGREDTFLGKQGADDTKIKGITSYLNKRLWEIPAGVEVAVQELRSTKRDEWPRSLSEAQNSQPEFGPDRRYNRRTILGAKYFVTDVQGTAGTVGPSGAVSLGDGTTIHWFLWSGERPQVHAYAHKLGYVAALYRNELYDAQNHLSVFRSFGITHKVVRDNLTLIAVPPPTDGTYGVYPDTARNALKIQGTHRAGESLPWAEWAQAFAERLPDELRHALALAGPTARGTLDDPSWRKRLADRFGSRWKVLRFVAATAGPEAIKPTEGVTNVGNDEPREDEPREDEPRDDEPRDDEPRDRPRPARPHAGATNAAGTAGVEDGLPARAVRHGQGLPDYEWSSAAEIDDSGAYAAAWSRPSAARPAGLVQIARDYPAIVEVKAHWHSQYPDHMAERIDGIVEEVYGSALVARVAHSERLVADPAWGRARVEAELRSSGALTMALLGLFSEDNLIAARIAALGVRRRAS